MNDQPSEHSTSELQAAMYAAISKSRNWFLIFGGVLIVLGCVAVIFPFITTIATKIFLGWLFIIGGIVQTFHAFSTRDWSGFIFNLLVGLLYLVAGAWLAFLPLSGIVTLTIFLALTFIVQGGLEAALALKLRPNKGWGWMFTAGLVSVLVGVLIIAKLPSSAAWSIGLLVGINMISSGWAFVTLALAVPKPSADT